MLTVRFDRLKIAKGDRLLDIGCGFGRHAYGAARQGASVIACDLAPEELKQVRSTYYAMKQNNEIDKGVEVASVVGDVTDLPFSDASFNQIVASEVLEHIVDDEKALSELFRVLKPGGEIAVTVPAFFPEKICWLFSEDYHAPKAEGGHVRIYTKKELRAKLGSAGFVAGFSHFSHSLHSPYWWLKCLVGPENKNNRLVNLYHKFLCWDLMKQPTLTTKIEKMLNPVLGKSLVVYAQKPAVAKKQTKTAARKIKPAPKVKENVAA